MLTSPDGFVGVVEVILASVFLVVTLNIATAFKNVPLILAVVKPLEAKVIPVTPAFAEDGLVSVNVITVFEPVGTL